MPARTEAPTPTPPLYTPTPAATRASGPPPRLSGKLLFPVFDRTAQTYNLYQLDLAGGQPQLFLEKASQPAVTLDGKRVAWRSWDQDRRGLLSRELDGTEIWTMIEYNEAARPSWTPDNTQRFVFPSRQMPDRQSRLYFYTGAGDPPYIEIKRDGSPILGRAPTFTPDGRIVYQGCVREACGLYVMNADGTNPRQITLFADDTAPAVSPDGKQVVYMSKATGYWQVSLVNIDGTDQHLLTDDWYWNGLPVWSPDGKYIIFVSTRDENWPNNFVLSENSTFRLWVMGAGGAGQQALNDFQFRLDGIPAGSPPHETAGWLDERLDWRK
jgi:TolB protein